MLMLIHRHTHIPLWPLLFLVGCFVRSLGLGPSIAAIDGGRGPSVRLRLRDVRVEHDQRRRELLPRRRSERLPRPLQPPRSTFGPAAAAAAAAPAIKGVGAGAVGGVASFLFFFFLLLFLLFLVVLIVVDLRCIAAIGGRRRLFGGTGGRKRQLRGCAGGDGGSGASSSARRGQ